MADNNSVDRVSFAECTSIRLLYADGWGYVRLSNSFDRNEETIGRHARGECGHVRRGSIRRKSNQVE